MYLAPSSTSWWIINPFPTVYWGNCNVAFWGSTIIFFPVLPWGKVLVAHVFLLKGKLDLKNIRQLADCLFPTGCSDSKSTYLEMVTANVCLVSLWGWEQWVGSCTTKQKIPTVICEIVVGWEAALKKNAVWSMPLRWPRIFRAEREVNIDAERKCSLFSSK